MISTIKSKQFKIIAALLAVVLVVSCITWNATKVHAEEITIGNSNVQGYSLIGTSGANIDGKLEGTWDLSATMSVFVTGGSADKYNATNAEWTHDGTIWTGASTVLYEGSGSAQKIYACSPYAADAANGVITVNAADQTDWLVATSTALNSSRVNLNMTHALAKLVIVPTYGTEVTDQTIAKIEIGGMYASGDLNIADNTWSALGTADATLEMIHNELLVIPMAECTSFPVIITMADGRVFTTTVTCPDGGLKAGTQYNINLQVGQDTVNIGGITAEAWISTLGGELETE